MRKLTLLGAVFGAGILAYSCGGGGTSSGTVGAFITDANDLRNQYQDISINLQHVALVNTNTGSTCVLFDGSQTMNLLELQNSMRLLDVVNCPAGVYNQVRLVISRDVNVTDTSGNTKTCQIDPARMMQMEDDTQVVCSENENTCIINVEVEDGGLVISEGTNEVAVDFEISDSDGDGNGSTVNVNVDNGTCTVAFEIEEIEPEEMEDHMMRMGKMWEIEGIVRYLTDTSFQVYTEHGMVIVVTYDGNSTQVNGGILQENTKVEVKCSNLDINTATCTASSIEIELNS